MLATPHGPAGRIRVGAIESLLGETDLFARCDVDGSRAWIRQRGTATANRRGHLTWNEDGSHAFTRLVGSLGSDSSVAIAPSGLVDVSVITHGALDARPSRGGNDVAVVKMDPSGAFS